MITKDKEIKKTGYTKADEATVHFLQFFKDRVKGVPRENDKEEQSHLEKTVKNEMLQICKKRFANATFDGYQIYAGEKQEKAKKISQRYANNIEGAIAKGAGLLYVGNSGTGKDHLIAPIIYRALLKRICVKRIKFKRVMDDVKYAWKFQVKQKESEIVEKLLKPELLILGEVGVDADGDAERRVLFDILDGRYEDEKSTIITSNLSEEAFWEKVDFNGFNRTKRRIKTMCLAIPCDWQGWEEYQESLKTKGAYL